MDKISVILPSRGRPEKLTAAVKSILDTASDPDRIEVIVRLDNDDPHAHALVSPNCYSIFGPRYRGYLDMDRYWNELARFASGRWLVSFNDDARMTEPAWDKVLDMIEHEYVLVRPQDNFAFPRWCSFPIITRSVYDIWGHITMFPGIDTWLTATVGGGDIIPVFQTHSIVVEHQRPNISGFEALHDKTWEESDVAEQFLCNDWERRAEYWGDLAEIDRCKLRNLELMK